MELYEYQIKNILKNYNIPVPESMIVTNEEEMVETFEVLSGPFLLKAQTLLNLDYGTKVKNAPFPQEGRIGMRDFNALLTRGLILKKVLMEREISPKKEFAISFKKLEENFLKFRFALLGSIDFKIIEKNYRELLFQDNISSIEELNLGLLKISEKFNIEEYDFKIIKEILFNLYRLFIEKDVLYVELNPLTKDYMNNFYVVDCKMILKEGKND